MGDSCHSKLVSRVTPSFLGDEGDKLLLDQVQETLKASQMPKYKYFHARLLECYRFLEGENAVLLRAVQKNQQVSEPSKQIDELLDEFAFKVASKKDAHEKQAIREASIEGRQAFMAKRWKSRYYSLLESSDILGKLMSAQKFLQGEAETDLEKRERLDWILDEVKRLLLPSSVDFKVSVTSGRAVEDLTCDESSGTDIKYSDYTANDFVVPLSSIFLVDLLANHLLCEQRLKQQADSKPHLIHMLRREKKRRNYHKNQCSRLEDEVFLMEKYLKQLDKLKRRLTTDGDESASTLRPGGVEPKPTDIASYQEQTEEEITAELDILEKESARIDDKIKELESVLKEEETQRRTTLKRLQVLTGTISVCCKIDSHDPSCLEQMGNDKLLVHVPSPPTQGQLTSQQSEAATVIQCFIFDTVCGPGSGNCDVFKNIELLVTMALHGQPVSVLVCGPDERENSHTLYGRPENGGEPGLAQLCVNQIFDSSRKRSRWTYTYHAFALICGASEVYNLLADHAKRTPLNITPDESEFLQAGTFGLRIASPSDFDSVIVLINDKMRSSRRPPGYLFLILRIHSQHTGDPDRSVTSWLYLADLSSGQQPEPTQPLTDSESIDCACGRAVGKLNSLFVALRWRKRPNFKECPLTQLMQPMLTGLTPQVTINNELHFPPFLPETIQAVQQISSWKAPGSDVIPPEVYKPGGPRLMVELTTIYQEVQHQGQVTRDFKDATIVHL
ncbi:unnamed protein product [Schistocephalus solidus]|uniref:Kinesin motor domain-containing protein n=1 Tax=Schistocephalus solidus TaxID=70667 RepID=A0A183SCW5_SCHSO|nr:unnamed protein product [Schistocephalus solidus]